MSPLLIHKAQTEFGTDASDIPPAWADAEAVLLAPRYLNKQLSCVRFYREGTPAAPRQGRPAPLIILDPMHFYMYLERSDELRQLFSQVDVLLPSEDEVNRLFGPIDPVQGAKLLAEFGPATVVVKVGSRGCVVYQRATDTVTRLPAFLTNAVDPTGAGDSFCGGFLVGLRESGDPITAALYGTISSSFIVEGFGAQHSYQVTRALAEQRLAALREKI